LNHHPPDPTIPRLADPLLTTAPAAVIGRRSQPRQAPQLAPVPELTPREELPHQQPRPVRPDPFEVQQPAHLLHLGGLVLADLVDPLPLQLADLAADHLPTLELAKEA